MKTTFVAIALAATLAQPATATTFPTLTTIYIGSGVRDDDGAPFAGVASVFMCSNVSGLSAQGRFLILNAAGGVQDQHTTTMAHGATFTAATHLEATFAVTADLDSGAVAQGAINIESTQSGVFCTAAVVYADIEGGGIPLHLVRVNSHPGTVE